MDSTQPPLATIQNSLTFRLSRLQSRLNTQAAEILKQHADITLTQWRCLSTVLQYGAQTQNDIMKLTFLDKAQINRAIKTLVNDSFASLEDSQDDNRKKHIIILPKGQKLFETITPIMSQRQKDLLHSLGKDEMEQFYKIIDQIHLNLDHNFFPTLAPNRDVK